MGRRVFGRATSAGGPGAGVQLWWQVEPGCDVVSASVRLEVLEPPTPGRRYAWGLQATVV